MSQAMNTSVDSAFKAKTSIEESGTEISVGAFSARLEEGTWRFRGSLCEAISFRLLAAVRGTLRIDFSGVHTVTYLGAVSLLSLVEDRGSRPIEFHQCTPPIVDAINNLPGLLGSPHDRDVVRSVIMHLSCAHCDRRAQVLIEIAKIKASGLAATCKRMCGRCGQEMLTAESLDDSMLFMSLDERRLD